jgi:hypothetical protein
MKKLLCSILLLTVSFNVFSQADPLEKKLKLKELEIKYLTEVSGSVIPKLNCNCERNLLQDGNFTTVLTNGSNISSASPKWKPGAASPQYSKTQGACDSGFVSMWGNKRTGESIYQTGLSLKQGKCYTIKFNARFLNNTGANNPYVQLAVTGSTSATPASPFPLSPSAAVSAPITNTTWASYSLNFTATANFNTLSFSPVNGNSQDNGAYVSWIQLDNVCIQECCNCGDWRGVAFGIYTKGSKEENIVPSEKEGKLLSCGKGVVVNAGSILKLNPVFYCSGNACAASYKGTVLLPNGSTQAIAGFPYTFSQSVPGYYSITVTPTCGEKTCTPCTIRVFVTPGCQGDILPEVRAGDGRG